MLIGNYKETYAADEALFRTPTARAWVAVGAAAAGVLAIGALGLNILTGFTGQISLGHAAFMGIGAYATAVLAARAGWPFWLAVPAGGAAACLAGMVVGVPSLRIKGLYLAIATLAAQVIFEWIFTNWSSVTGGISPQLGAVGLRIFPVVILGGLDSIGGALVGGVVIGILENLAGGYLDPLLEGGGVKEVAPFVALVVILMFRPYGLFGTREIERL